MQTLIRYLVAVGAFVPNAYAKPKPVVEMLVVKHYGREITQIFKTGKSWYCKTELRPYYESKTQPFDTGILKVMDKLMRSDRKLASDCRDKVFIIDHTGEKTHEIAACKTDYPFAKFVEQLSRNCGR